MSLHQKRSKVPEGCDAICANIAPCRLTNPDMIVVPKCYDPSWVGRAEYENFLKASVTNVQGLWAGM